MPRGNDKDTQEQALHELADDFGKGVGNAEEMIRRNTALRTADLATVSSFPVDDEASSELDLDKVELPDGMDGYVVDAVVRKQGRSQGTVAVVEDDNGRTNKVLVDSNLEDTRGHLRRDRDEEDGPRRSSRAKSREGDTEAESGSASAKSQSGGQSGGKPS
jgi:hypothetical protein